MNDSVKCLGFAELLQKAKTYQELAIDYDLIPLQPNKAWKDYLSKKWVSVDVLKEFSLSLARKEHSVRKKLDELFQDFPMPSREKYYQQCYTGTPVFMSDLWDKDFYQWEKRVFDETFSQKGSLQEKKESVQTLVKFINERLGIYISIDREGFYIEFGKLEPPTSFLTFAFTRNWWKP